MQNSHGAWALAGLSVIVWLSGCTREPEAPAAPAPQSGASTSAEEPVPAESSLAIKRGMMSISEDRSTFTLCNSQDELWVLDQSPGMLTQTLIEGEQAAPVSFYAEAYGERAPLGEVPEAQGLAGVFVLEDVLYAGVPGEGRGCDAPEPTFIVAARGNEPFWAVEVHDDQVIFRQPEEPKEIVFGEPQTVHAEGAVRYTGTSGEHRLKLMVHAQPCRDSMSGEFFAYTAKAIVNARELSGCARVGR